MNTVEESVWNARFNMLARKKCVVTWVNLLNREVIALGEFEVDLITLFGGGGAIPKVDLGTMKLLSAATELSDRLVLEGEVSEYGPDKNSLTKNPTRVEIAIKPANGVLRVRSSIVGGKPDSYYDYQVVQATVVPIADPAFSGSFVAMISWAYVIFSW